MDIGDGVITPSPNPYIDPDLLRDTESKALLKEASVSDHTATEQVCVWWPVWLLYAF